MIACYDNWAAVRAIAAGETVTVELPVPALADHSFFLGAATTFFACQDLAKGVKCTVIAEAILLAVKSRDMEVRVTV